MIGADTVTGVLAIEDAGANVAVVALLIDGKTPTHATIRRCTRRAGTGFRLDIGRLGISWPPLPIDREGALLAQCALVLGMPLPIDRRDDASAVLKCRRDAFKRGAVDELLREEFPVKAAAEDTR